LGWRDDWQYCQKTWEEKEEEQPAHELKQRTLSDFLN
jgi:hypothetical protein